MQCSTHAYQSVPPLPRSYVVGLMLTLRLVGGKECWPISEEDQLAPLGPVGAPVKPDPQPTCRCQPNWNAPFPYYLLVAAEAARNYLTRNCWLGADASLLASVVAAQVFGLDGALIPLNVLSLPAKRPDD
ncbi:hypothetical protein Nepgr_021425 [Nepenthes gracilis]|uniref:Uncharacterized protein n=1 Tax=Nepenthes gracilis TaxID=150966 RepID=A0AAD3SYL8_NEPGR|nr:hypothetical protein Nepgr_021425 [Nepenthes gracilis]